MTKYEANQKLQKIRCGDLRAIGKAEITELLILTGDVGTHAPVRSEGMDAQACNEDWRGRVRERAIVVGQSKR